MSAMSARSRWLMMKGWCIVMNSATSALARQGTVMLELPLSTLRMWVLASGVRVMLVSRPATRAPLFAPRHVSHTARNSFATLQHKYEVRQCLDHVMFMHASAWSHSFQGTLYRHSETCMATQMAIAVLQ